MFISGHLSTAYLVHRLGNISLRAIALASLFPDIVDKCLQFFGVFASGRHVAHNLFALVLSTLLVAILCGKRSSFSWLLGYAGHLLADLPFSWSMPWFFPLEFGSWHHTAQTWLFNMSKGQVLTDAVLTLTALVVYSRERGWFGRWSFNQGSANP